VLLTLVINGLPDITSPPKLTLITRGKTEAIEIALADQRRQTWLLPKGTYTTTSADEKASCPAGIATQTGSCQYVFTGPTVLRVNGPASLRLEIAGHGIVLSTGPLPASNFDVEVLDAGNRVVIGKPALLTFESSARGDSLRLPVILQRATLGAALYETVEAFGPSEGGAQPVLREGNFELIAGAGDARQRFSMSQESLETGDLVTLAANPLENAAAGLIAGFITVNDVGNPEKDAIFFSLSVPVTVRWRDYTLGNMAIQRAGATNPTLVGVPSRWVILGHWPTWQAFWWTLVAIAGFGELLFSWRTHMTTKVPTHDSKE
jgi:hypothetical protein